VQVIKRRILVLGFTIKGTQVDINGADVQLVLEFHGVLQSHFQIVPGALIFLSVYVNEGKVVINTSHDIQPGFAIDAVRLKFKQDLIKIIQVNL